MKNFIKIASAALLSMSILFVSCSSRNSGTEISKNTGAADKKSISESESIKDNAGKKTVTASTALIADLVRELSGDLFHVETVIPGGSDIHQYVAKPSDLQKIEKADLVLYNGLNFEGNLTEALSKTGKAVTADLDVDELLNSSHEHGKEHETEHEREHGGEAHGHGGVDPHFWFDPDLYEDAIDETAKQLSQLDPSAEALINKNASEYEKKVEELDKKIKKTVSEIPEKNRYIVTAHDALGYFGRRYGFNMFSPQGISTETEASAKDIQDTIDLIVKNDIKAIFVEASSDPAKMKKIQDGVRNAGKDVNIVQGEDRDLLTDSLAAKGQDGDTYISMMEHNLRLIFEALK